MQIKIEKTTSMAGQYIFICCPEISHFQYHPFTLSKSGRLEDIVYFEADDRHICSIVAK